MDVNNVVYKYIYKNIMSHLISNFIMIFFYMIRKYGYLSL